MHTLPISSVKPEMVVYEDIYSQENALIIKANMRLTQEMINTLVKQGVKEISISDPGEIDMTHYRNLQADPRFQRFCKQYEQSLNIFINILHTLETGLDFNTLKILSMRDDLKDLVRDVDQLMDYLYNMMPDENEITYKHCFNCGLMCYVFGKWLNISGKDLDNLTLAGFLFDIGKTKLPETILWKPDKLTAGEYTQVKRHIHMGYELLFGKELPPHVISVMIMHHERCDRSGYPARIPTERIDPFALIAAVADTYEAITSPRAQRLALTPFHAIRIFEEQGIEAKYGKDAKTILTRIANIYLDRRICVTGNMTGRIVEIHEDALARPTVSIHGFTHDLRANPNMEILRMA